MVDIDNNLRFHNLKESAIIAIPLTMFEEKFAADIEAGYKYLITTVGRVILNTKLPAQFPYLNEVNASALKAIPAKYLVKSAADLEKAFKEMPAEE
jgi:DNA-directed RNA polymerase subunit beta'